MRSILLVCILAIAGVAAAGSPAALGGHETARATDLLRAQKLADEAARRLRLPAARTHTAWAHGGDGWTRRDPPEEARDPGVTIRLAPERRHRRAER
jgi:hypothetical protein